MATTHVGPTFTLPAAADLSSSQYLAVTLSSGNAAVVSTAGGFAVGLLVNAPDEAGKAATIQRDGTAIGVAGAAVTEGMPLTSNASGKLVEANDDLDHVIGYAREAASADEQFEVELMPRIALSGASTSGIVAAKGFSAVYDVSGGDSGAVGTHGLGVTIPARSLVLAAAYVVDTTFTDGASDTATLALQIESAGDITSAIAVSHSSDPWDAASPVNFTAGSIDSLANAVFVNAASEVSAVVAVAPLTAGKLTVSGLYIPVAA